MVRFINYKKSNRWGLTLVELLITTTIVGIIMMGIVSVDFALRTSEQQQTRAALVSLRTSALLQDIISNAQQAYGDAATRCIQTNNLTIDNNNYICIYRDLNTPVTPSDFSDDRWVCYTRRATNMHKCQYTSAVGPRACGAADPVIATVTTDTFNAPDTPVVVNVDPDFYFQITIKSRFDPTAAGAGTFAAGLPQEHLTNPKIQMTSRVTPSACVP